MMTTRMKTKRYIALLAGLFMFSMAFAQQQNFLGFAGSKAELKKIEFRYFENGITTGLPDKEFTVHGTHELYQMDFDKIKFFIYHDIRLATNKFIGSHISMNEEHEINVNVLEMQKGEMPGKLMLICENGVVIEPAYMYDSENKTLLLNYAISDWDNMQYIEERDQKIADGLLLEVQDYEQTTTPGIYTVSVHYLIK